MKIDPERYDTRSDAERAGASTGISGLIKTYRISRGLRLAEKEQVGPTSRISLKADIKHPKEFEGYTLLVELDAVDEIVLWDDIDSDNRCLGQINWFGNDSSILHLGMNVSLETMKEFIQLLLAYDNNSTLEKYISASAVGLVSIEFMERELKKGVAVMDVSVSVVSL